MNAATAVDRRAAWRDDPAALAAVWPHARLLVVDADGRVPLTAGERPRLRWARATRLARSARAAWLLGEAGGLTYFAAPGEPEPPLAGLRELPVMLEEPDATLGVQAVALAAWHARSGYCPSCGSRTRSVSAGHARVCPTEGIRHFPRTDPAIIVLITDPAGQMALLGRRPVWPAGRFSCLAGFVEAGESAEAAVVREVAEESGVHVDHLRYLGSQPWPYPGSLMLAFRGVADPAAPVTVDPTELAEVRWVPRGELGGGASEGGYTLPPVSSVAYAMLQAWLTAG